MSELQIYPYKMQGQTYWHRDIYSMKVKKENKSQRKHHIMKKKRKNSYR